MFKKLNRTSKITTAVLYTYDNILLTTYMEIAQTGNTNLLVITGTPTEKEIAEQWEKIVKRNSEVNGLGIGAYFDNIKTYAKLLADYEMVKLSLMQLMFVVDDDTIAYLQSKGYRIDKSGAKAYSASIQSALLKCRNIITKLKTRYNQLAQANQDGEKVAKTSMEEVLANISVAIGFSVGMDVTLARFNEYKRIVKKRYEAQKMKKAA